MSDGLYFNLGHETHHLRLLAVDDKPNDVTVWQATVDNEHYIYFEATSYESDEIWILFELAIREYREYIENDEVTGLKWREGTSYE